MGYSYNKFQKKVLQRDGFKCVKCGSRKELNPMPIYSLKKFPQLKDNDVNYQTLCPNCQTKDVADYRKNLYLADVLFKLTDSKEHVTTKPRLKPIKTINSTKHSEVRSIPVEQYLKELQDKNLQGDS